MKCPSIDLPYSMLILKNNFGHHRSKVSKIDPLLFWLLSNHILLPCHQLCHIGLLLLWVILLCSILCLKGEQISRTRVVNINQFWTTKFYLWFIPSPVLWGARLNLPIQHSNKASCSSTLSWTMFKFLPIEVANVIGIITDWLVRTFEDLRSNTSLWTSTLSPFSSLSPKSSNISESSS